MLAGRLTEDADGYTFAYDSSYLALPGAEPVSLTLPLTAEPYHSKVMFPFFDGLVPEGWLLNITTKNWKINPNDRMALLMTCCQDCIGAVGVVGIETGDDV
jgi:serine/threonine-protein kinase HipA